MSVQTELVVEPATSCYGKTTRLSNKGGIDGAAACPPGLKADLPGLEDTLLLFSCTNSRCSESLQHTQRPALLLALVLV